MVLFYYRQVGQKKWLYNMGCKLCLLCIINGILKQKLMSRRNLDNSYRAEVCGLRMYSSTDADPQLFSISVNVLSS